MSTKYAARVPFSVNDVEVIADVNYSYLPGSPAVMYQRNGDPGWPAEAPEMEILTIEIDGHPAPKWLDRLLSEDDHFRDWILEHHDDAPRGRDPDRAYDEWRDRQMEREP